MKTEEHMLAVLGFTVASLLIALFSTTFQYKGNKYKKELQNFRTAYLLLAIAFLGYGIASMVGTQSALSISMLVGNVLLIIATTYILTILIKNKRKQKVAIYGTLVCGIGLIIVRIMFFYPKPYIEDEMLFFNSQRFVSFVISAVFLLIWLPVSLKVSALLTSKDNTRHLATTMSVLYMSATFCAIMFMLAKKPITLVLSFIALSLSFILLILTNVALSKTETTHGRK